MNSPIPPEDLRIALKEYRRDVPSVGTVSFEKSQNLLEQGRICRGWTKIDQHKRYFHVIRSADDLSKRVFMNASSEKELFTMSVFLGMDAGIDFDLLVGREEPVL